MKKRALFIDRDGTMIVEPKIDFQVDTLEKLEFIPYTISTLAKISELDYELVMVSNQDGRGTLSFPEDSFLAPHNKMLDILKSEGVVFDNILIDGSFPEENSPNRKPRTGMLKSYMTDKYDLENSIVIGDRLTDVELAKNLGAKAVFFTTKDEGNRALDEKSELKDSCEIITNNWHDVYEYIRFEARTATVERVTKETNISLFIDLDGRGESSIKTPLNFLNHMLDQIVHHSGISMKLEAKGDTNIDDHHTIEDIGIVLGEALKRALLDKRGINRYGFSLPMDECDATVTLDLGGRIDFIWEVEFTRDMIGDVSSEMFEHFFKSFAQSAMMNLHISAKGKNNHHLIEGVFKGFSRALKSAIKRDIFDDKVPTSKGLL